MQPTTDGQARNLHDVWRVQARTHHPQILHRNHDAEALSPHLGPAGAARAPRSAPRSQWRPPAGAAVTSAGSASRRAPADADELDETGPCRCGELRHDARSEGIAGGLSC